MRDNTTLADWNRFDRKGRFLLVVDSDPDHLCFVSALLQRFAYKTFSASTAKEALTMTAVAVPSLILIATDLTDGSILSLRQQLMQNSSTAEIPCIALRNLESLIGEKQCLQQGAVKCLAKPVSPEQLYQAVQTAIETTPRAHIRIRTLLPIHSNDTSHDCFDNACTTDLSEGGMFVRTSKPASVHTQLSCQFHLYDQSIHVLAIVLYSNRSGRGLYREPGMGLQFARIGSRDQDLIRRFIRTEVVRGIPPVNA